MKLSSYHTDLKTLHVDILADVTEQERIVSDVFFLVSSPLTSSTTGTSPGCSTAFHQPSDTHVQVACQANNVRTTIHCYYRSLTAILNNLQVNLAITFCD